MNIKFDNAEFSEILSDFHTITKMRIVIFDDDFNKIAAYPEKSCDEKVCKPKHCGGLLRLSRNRPQKSRECL
ncbi:MAG: hypothetical protein SPL89_02555 [Clostridia bacterium]|nr:hypothetical protein [Clostridia bacterium]